MKVAFISDSLKRPEHQGIIKTREHLMDFYVAETVDEFEQKHGNLKSYDGMFFHSSGSKKGLDYIKKTYPNLKIILISMSLSHLTDKYDIDETGCYYNNTLLVCRDVAYEKMLSFLQGEKIE